MGADLRRRKSRHEALAAVVALSFLVRPAPAALPLVAGLDHVVIAVADLDSAAAVFGDLG